MDPQTGAPLTDLPDQIPQQLGRYRLVRLIGKGGMGLVYEATHIHLEKKVALKVLRRSLADDKHFLERFYREIKALGQVVDTTHVILATDGGEEVGIPFLTMEFVDGVNLDELLKQTGGKLPVGEACELVRQAALGLDAIHQHGLVHRDLKPTNLMLTSDGIVKILDLGLVRLLENDEDRLELTPTYGVLGTVDYQAPEQAINPRDADIRSDIYSLGCTLFKLLTGRAPYSDFERFKKTEAHASAPVPALPDNVPEGIRAVVAKLLAKKPVDRYQTPFEVAQVLAPFANETPSTAPTRDVVSHPLAPTPVAMTTPVNMKSMTLSARSETTPGATRLTTETPGPARGLAPVWIACAFAVLAVGMVLGYTYWPGEVVSPNANPQTNVKNDGALKTGPERPVLDKLMPRQSRFLLDHKPEEVLWKPRNASSSYSYDEKARKFTVTCATNEHALFRLGTVTTDSYELQVDIFQPSWTDGVGVFIGYHKHPEPRLLFEGRKDVVIGECQILFFQYVDGKDNAGKPRREYRIHRGIGEHQRKSNGQELVFLHGHGSEKFSAPIDNRSLTLVVRKNRLRGVYLAGISEFKDIVAREHDKTFEPELHKGDFGIWVCGTVVSFQDALFRLLEK